MGFWVWLLCIGNLFASTSVLANTPVLNLNQRTQSPLVLMERNSLQLDTLLSVYEDKGANLKIQEIEKAHESGSFKLLNGTRPNFGYSSSAFWMNFYIAAGTEGYWFLEIDNTFIDYVDVYTRDDGQADRVHMMAGDLRPMSSRLVPTRYFRFPVDFKGKPKQVFVRVQGEGALSVPLRIFSSREAGAEEWVDSFGKGAFAGVILVLCLYNLFLYFGVRESAYLYYIFYVGCFGVTYLDRAGILKQVLWGDWLWIANRANLFFYNLAGYFSLRYIHSFFNITEKMPRLNQAIKTFGYFYLAALIVCLFLPYRIAANIVTLSGILLGIAGPIIAFATVKLKLSFAKTFFAGSIARFIGILCFSFTQLGLLPNTTVTEHSIVIGTLIEVVVFAYILANRFLIMKDQYKKIKYEARLQSEKAERAEIERRLEEIRHSKEREQIQHEALMSRINQMLAIADRFNSPMTAIMSRHELISMRAGDAQKLVNDLSGADVSDKFRILKVLTQIAVHGESLGSAVDALKVLSHELNSYRESGHLIEERELSIHPDIIPDE